MTIRSNPSGDSRHPTQKSANGAHNAADNTRANEAETALSRNADGMDEENTSLSRQSDSSPPSPSPFGSGSAIGFETSDPNPSSSDPAGPRWKRLNEEDLLLAAGMLKSQGEGQQHAFLNDRGMLHETAQTKRKRTLRQLAQQPQDKTNAEIAVELSEHPETQEALLEALNLLRPDWLRLSVSPPLEAALKAVLSRQEEVRRAPPLIDLPPHEFEAELARTSKQLQYPFAIIQTWRGIAESKSLNVFRAAWHNGTSLRKTNERFKRPSEALHRDLNRILQGPESELRTQLIQYFISSGFRGGARYEEIARELSERDPKGNYDDFVRTWTSEVFSWLRQRRPTNKMAAPTDAALKKGAQEHFNIPGHIVEPFLSTLRDADQLDAVVELSEFEMSLSQIAATLGMTPLALQTWLRSCRQIALSHLAWGPAELTKERIKEERGYSYPAIQFLSEMKDSESETQPPVKTVY